MKMLRRQSGNFNFILRYQRREAQLVGMGEMRRA
jgi:hypothetical protein